MSILLIIAFTVVQFGLSWWISVPTLVTFLLWMRFRKLNSESIHHFQLLKYSTFFLMLISVFVRVGFTSHDLLRTSREIFVLGLYSYFSKPRDFGQLFKSKTRTLRILLVLSCFLTLLAIIQYYFLKGGRLIGPPARVFSGRASNLPTSLDLKYSHIRPSGLFSEPSYFGQILFSIMFVVSPLVRQVNFARLIFAISFAGSVLTQSKSAVVFVLLLLVTIILEKPLKSNSKAGITGILLIFSTLLILSIPLLKFVVSSFKDSQSLGDRIFTPFSIVPQFMIQHPFGVPFYSRIGTYVSVNSTLTWNNISHNSIFNFFFSYGIGGIFLTVMTMLLVKRDVRTKLLIFILLIQNGSFLDLDKLVLFAVAWSSYNYFKNYSNYSYLLKTIDSGIRNKSPLRT